MVNFDESKKLLLPPAAGVEILEQYGLYCEDRYDWETRKSEPLLRRTLTGHAPFDSQWGGKMARLNTASPDAEFRQWSVEILSNYLRIAAQYTPARLIVMHSAPRYWVEDAGEPCPVRTVGEYGHLVDSMKKIARLAGELGLRVAVENNCTRWDEIPEEEEFDPERHLGRVRQYFCTYPQEWSGLIADVDEPALGLCMDTSHATNFAHRYPLEERPLVYHRFIDQAGDRLWHVHWNDNMMHTKDGRGDPHLNLGKGSVPLDVHRRLWRHPSIETYLLEHWWGEEELIRELEFFDKEIRADDDTKNKGSA